MFVNVHDWNGTFNNADALQGFSETQRNGAVRDLRGAPPGDDDLACKSRILPQVDEYDRGRVPDGHRQTEMGKVNLSTTQENFLAIAYWTLL